MSAGVEETEAVLSPEELAHREWAQERLTAVTGAHGPLALVDFHEVSGRERVIDLPMSAEPGPDGQGVLIVPDEGAQIDIDGTPVTEPTVLSLLRGDGTPLLTCGGTVVDAFSLDGDSVELRIYRAENEQAQRFAGIEVYPFDPELVVRGEFRPYSQATDVTWGFSRESDDGHDKKVPGVVEVEVGGKRYDLVAFLDHGLLVIVFADGTTGRESHAPGRFLKLSGVTGAGPVKVDFNQAFIPPCGFSDYFNCPLPPAENRIEAPVRGGEKHVLWADETDGHRD
ncbi:Uncharacterized conserved protein, DUF1684 family [Austwickia chelonae]|uniref:DUF1684 domain-containing protein n=1 Tax=Austwickia chelonae NBRC 105200 TaxID=1184607 RepID=K6VNG0_9MICO|nr:DUF1684 domain-containing protein [Austwickia chelonae]GAB78269.1 hypothetical protein AUCHE_08_05150 [Austwickia chelonae NBRC 105200]SEW00075.1 Uncharacterized conserved protein, DUF1684 family [Austwickia chelonae]